MSENVKIQSAKLRETGGHWFIVIQTNGRHMPYTSIVPEERTPQGPQVDHPPGGYF